MEAKEDQIAKEKDEKYRLLANITALMMPAANR